jgi:thiamine biosynthesis lipoprotein
LLRTREREFRAMGTDCHVYVVADDAAVDDVIGLARDRVELLEDCWSRFRPGSELNRLNASAGQGPQQVSADLYLLVERMREAWSMSGGLFDPTVLTSMTAWGYDADFDIVSARPSAQALDDVLTAAAPGMSGVELDEVSRTISLPPGVGIDPGAIGKGLAGDVIAAELFEAGAHGVLINLGGDVSFIGDTEDGTGWSIAVEDERRPVDDPDRVIRVFEFPDGCTTAGIATSTTLKRRWAQGRRHHVIDPRTGAMSVSDLVQVTVVDEEAWRAEITATTALLMTADEAARWLRDRDVTAILLTTERTIVTTDEEEHDG